MEGWVWLQILLLQHLEEEAEARGCLELTGHPPGSVGDS